MKKLVLSLFILVTMSVAAIAQERTVSGMVTSSEDGLPIPGVSVKVKEAPSVGGTTGADGKFSLKVPANGRTLIISYLGFTTKEMAIPASNVVNAVLMSDERVLGEVIVTGVAGATEKAKMTVSVTKISAEQINATPALSMSSALSGKVSGVKASSSSGSPGSAVDIQLRSDNNLNNVGSGPLVLIDGVILNGGISDINADDVESMEVVKGAAASSLYGSRAGNGVISITTKRGKGIALNSVKINVRNEVGLQQIGNKIDLATHHPYALAADAASAVGKYTKYAGVTYPAGYTGAGFNPGITGNRIIDADHYADNDYGVVTDQQDLFFRTGVNYTNFVSFATNSEKSAVYASFENNAQKGIIKFTDGYERQNFRFNIDQQLTKWLKFTSSNLMINSKSNTPGSTGGVFFDIALAEPDADLLQTNPIDGQPYYPRSLQFSGTYNNPLYNLYKQNRDSKTRRWIGNYALNAKINKWASFDISQSIEIQNVRSTNYSPKDTWTGTGGTAATYGMAYTNGSLTKSSSETNSQNTQATLNLSHDFNDLTVRGKLSYLFENRKFEDYSVNASQFVYKDIPDFSNFPAIQGANSSIENEKAQNYFAILGLDYKDRYLFDGMFRRDGSSLFGPDARWNNYFRLSGAYRISQDVTIPGIDELKVRAAYGTAGIRPGFDWQYDRFTLSNGVPNAFQAGNPNLKPSKTAETEFGLNVDFLKKFSFEAVYAKSKTTDQFLNSRLVPFLSEGGQNQKYINAGTVKANTLELTLGAKWIKTPSFSWSSNIVFSRVRQKITELPIAPYLFGTTDGGGAQMFYVKEGETYGAMYGYDWVTSLAQMSAQLPAGKTIADYEINSDGYVIPKGTQGTLNEKAIKLVDANGTPWYGKIGDGNADFNMGIANTLNYKGISLYFLVDIKKGGDVYNSKAQWITRDFRNPEMDMAGVPAGEKKAYDYYINFYSVNDVNKYWVEDASYIKLRELALGYSFPAKALGFSKGAIKGITAKLIGRNLFTITGYSGYDPEVGSLRTPYDGTYKYPNFRNYAFSLSFDF